MDGGETTEPGDRKGGGRREFARVTFGQSLLLTKASWNEFRVS